MKKKLLQIFLIIIFCIQGILYIKSEDNKDKSQLLENKETITKVNRKSFNEFFQDINNIDNSSLRNIENNGDSYTANLNIKGDKNNIISIIEELKEYDIRSFKININKNDIYAELSLIY